MKRYFAWVFFVLAAVNTLAIYHSYVTGGAATLTETFPNPEVVPSFLNSILNIPDGLLTAFFYWAWYRWK